MWTNCNMWDAVPQIQIDIKGETLSHLFEIGILGTCPQNLIIIGIVLTTVDNRCVLVTLDFLLLDQAFFLLTNLIKQNACRFVIGVLRYKFSLYRPL